MRSNIQGIRWCAPPLTDSQLSPCRISLMNDNLTTYSFSVSYSFMNKFWLPITPTHFFRAWVLTTYYSDAFFPGIKKNWGTFTLRGRGTVCLQQQPLWWKAKKKEKEKFQAGCGTGDASILYLFAIILFEAFLGVHQKFQGVLRFSGGAAAPLAPLVKFKPLVKFNPCLNWAFLFDWTG